MCTINVVWKSWGFYFFGLKFIVSVVWERLWDLLNFGVLHILNFIVKGRDIWQNYFSIQKLKEIII
jgi:hypothetical protein